MAGEVKEKRERKMTVSITLPEVPISVHNKIKGYRRKIMTDRGRDYGMMAAYTEFLKESTKNLEI